MLSYLPTRTRRIRVVPDVVNLQLCRSADERRNRLVHGAKYRKQSGGRRLPAAQNAAEAEDIGMISGLGRE